jgi:hypothetical protein
VARAQSAISGIVRDTSGAVLPGVTVEAASDALIEKTKTVTSDGQGRYQIVDLRPGLYVVTFTLPGFNTVRRDGVELPSNFTAQINADLRVGALEETVNVSGASPVVDVQNAVQQTVLSRAVLDAVPTGRSVPTLGALMVGARLAIPDVGGTSSMQNRDLTVHGSDGRDTTFQVDGMTLNGIEGDGSVQSYFNDMMFEEVSYQTSAISAEVSAGGVRANMIPKDGGNTFKGTLFFSGANSNLQSNNSDDAKALGLTAPDALNKVWDLNVSEGGPILKDRLWFFASYRDWGVYQYIANSFFGWGPKGPNIPGTTPTGEQTIDDASIRSGMVRLTTQFGKHKVAAYLDRIRKFRGHENSAGAGVVIAGEATDIRAPKQYYTTEGKWTSTYSSRLLTEVGYALNNESYDLTPLPESLNVIPRRDITLNTLYGAYDGGIYYREPIRRFMMASASYVTGSHAVKTGIQYQNGYFWRQRRMTADLVQRYRGGVPDSVIVSNTPQDSRADMNSDIGIFIQDSWTLGRLTLNPGVRFEHFNGSLPERQVAAGRFVPFRTFAEVKDLPNWNNVSPRFGMAWDIKGDGKTAVKFGVGKYMRSYTTGFAETYDPNFYDTDIRTWTDANNDDIAQNGEIGPAQNRNFGVRTSRRPTEGIGRPYQIEANVSVQREVIPGTSVTLSYFRRDYKDLIWTDNVAVNPSDYTPYTVPSPLNNGETVTIYNLDPSKLGVVDQLDQNSSNNYRKYNGYDLNFTSRLGTKLNVFGGFSFGKQVSNTCDVEDPNFLRFCDQSQYDIPYQAQVKISGSYVLPWAVQISGSLQSYPGDARNSTVDGTIVAEDPSLRVNWNINSATFRALTGVPLTVTQVIIPLNEPGSKFLKRQNQVDVRLKRGFNIRKINLEAQVDAYNFLNTGVVLTQNQTFGTALDRPTSILQGRLFRFGLQAKF